jgi:hypothetical protein
MYWQDLLQLADITFPRRGVIAGGRLEHFFAMLTGNKEFHELRTINCTRLQNALKQEKLRAQRSPNILSSFTNQTFLPVNG